jgi:hypothetical protein
MKLTEEYNTVVEKIVIEFTKRFYKEVYEEIYEEGDFDLYNFA